MASGHTLEPPSCSRNNSSPADGTGAIEPAKQVCCRPSPPTDKAITPESLHTVATHAAATDKGGPPAPPALLRGGAP